ncbi:hypothetical protein SADUNF_Sadunf13G0104500 [Salix dunnii]|uniref:Protein kinase domain-containing protein n=1 Tax=Salix dunnii TaxID=1413687 RepID=A0A835JJD0_9ROSI|nr:hypothetical protein SADUNF_Sadunf13G0104500 [Salix dunnii]
MSTSSMADELDQESKRVQLLYPTYPHAYKILEEIGGGGAGATIHKAICVHNQWKSSLVAIKIIDLEKSPAEFILWVARPCVMAAGSLQSIISSYFSDGLQEPGIAIILKETLRGLHYIHDQVRLHTDIKADNILIDTDKGSIKLADYGISVSIYDSSSNIEGSYSMSSSLVHGRPPLSHLPPSKSLLMKIKQRSGFSDNDDEKQKKDFKNKNFSKEFKDMDASCGSGDLEGLVGDHNGANMSGIQEIIEGLVALKKSLDEQRKRVVSFSVRLGGEADVEEQMMQRIENLMEELNLEKEKKLK